MTDSTAARTPNDLPASDATEEIPASETPTADTPNAQTPVGVWVLYALGILAATVFAASLLFIAIAYAVSGSSGVGLDISLPALVVWLALIVAAGGTFLWRRRGRAQ
jgi:hypothetical protein